VAPSAADLALDWVFDPASVLLLGVTGGLYALGVRRLARRGRRWPIGRTVAFGAGWLVLLVATCSGLGRYDTETFSAHAAQHALLGMAAPFLLVLGAPVTLALSASDRPTRTVLLRALHSAPVRLLTHPLVIWVLFGGTLVALYGSPLLEATTQNAAVHALVHLHVVVVGVLFCEVAFGADALPRPLPHWARLVFVLFAVPFHAVVGLALLGARDVVAPAAYASLHDQRIGAGILWGTGELFGLAAAGVVLARWMAAEDRAARREDRRLDALALE
jgi:cytochrome c oxidase assembly factor CtaG